MSHVWPDEELAVNVGEEAFGGGVVGGSAIGLPARIDPRIASALANVPHKSAATHLSRQDGGAMGSSALSDYGPI